MQRILKASIVLCVASWLVADIGRAQLPDRRPLPDRVRRIAASLQPTGRLPESMPLHLAIGLPLRHSEALTNLLNEIYDPASPRFHRYLSVEQFTGQFGPTEEEYQKAVQFLETNGLTIARSYRNRLLINIDGSVGNIERTFHMALRVYQHPEESRTFYAPDATPTVPRDIPILEVVGMDNFVLPRPMDLHPEPLKGGVRAFGTGSLYGNFTSGDLRAAYVPWTDLSGAGQSVGILAFDGYYSNDVVTFESMSGLSNVVVTNILLDGFSGAPGGHNLETALDIEMAMAMAPSLSSVIVYEGFYGDSILNQMAVDNEAKQLSSSWSFPISDNTSQELLEMKAQGQVMFQASGDSGNWGNLMPTPIDNPDLVDVGGTVLTTTGGRGAWVSETAWQFGGGGIGWGYLMPSWQTNIDTTVNHGSTSRRNVPDVAMVSLQLFMVGNNGGIYGIAGTSASAPLWAGFTALINQQENINDNPPVGFLSPTIYQIGNGTNYATCFHDIATGNNTNSSSPTDFFAVPGYDLCTGWGTPNGTNLINALAPFYPLRAKPIAGLSASGLAGGSFTPATQTFSISNATTAPLNWTVVNSSPWLDVFPVGGTLDSATGVTVAQNALVEYLPAGDYVTSLTFKDIGSGLGQSRSFTLSVNPSVTNGGFEVGNLSPWNLSGAANQSTVVSGNASFVHTGTSGVRLANVGLPLGYISQTIPTVPSRTYQFSFWLNSSANPNSPHKTTPNQFLVSWNGMTLFNQTNIGVIGWTNLQFYVTANGTSSVLQFGFRDDPWALGLDDITLQPVVPPSFQGFSNAGNALKYTWAAVAGLKYQIQYKTNLMQTNWVGFGIPAIATNYFLTTTNSIPGDPQRFYRIVWVP
jgi:hypothetical protein